MNANDEIANPNVAPCSAESTLYSRRELSRRLLGMAVICPLYTAHPVWNLLRTQGMPLAADAAASKPLFLTEDHRNDFAALAEEIVPGSVRAHVASFIDLLLSVSSSSVQKRFGRSLAVLRDQATLRFGSALAGLTPSQREAILASASNAPEDTAERSAFEDLKTWIVGAYYSSEIGMRELGWTPNRFFTSLPACPDQQRLG